MTSFVRISRPASLSTSMETDILTHGKKKHADVVLIVESSCPKCFDRYLDDASIKMFESMNVMKRNELEARNEVKWEYLHKENPNSKHV